MTPDYIKVDGSLIRNMHIEAKDALIVQTIITFAKNLGVKVVCEYVHNEEIYMLLKEMGADAFQGYYFSEPKRFL
jgi:EAL domain-containing protein (putative c-di-GMP-specific phosphodiesterase class I)